MSSYPGSATLIHNSKRRTKIRVVASGHWLTNSQSWEISMWCTQNQLEARPSAWYCSWTLCEWTGLPDPDVRPVHADVVLVLLVQASVWSDHWSAAVQRLHLGQCLRAFLFLIAAAVLCSVAVCEMLYDVLRSEPKTRRIVLQVRPLWCHKRHWQPPPTGNPSSQTITLSSKTTTSLLFPRHLPSFTLDKCLFSCVAAPVVSSAEDKNNNQKEKPWKYPHMIP